MGKFTCHGGPLHHRDLDTGTQSTLTFSLRGETGYYTRDECDADRRPIMGNYGYFWKTVKESFNGTSN